ncbi:sulfurtransferase TusA family protein [Vibrio profundum]|uniref:sulfurtransferase TusA family protein n=1 Tax=Vibrio profundum TaxID=2910247 RepID=UPI003D11ADD2
MKPNFLDLRDERCPRALLLAKRHIARLDIRDIATIELTELTSLQDIEHYLRNNDYCFTRVVLPDGWIIGSIQKLISQPL